MIDLFTVNVLVAVVTMTAGVLYLAETILRREVGAGRVWALAFLAGMLAVVAYLVWQALPDPWVAVAIGNAALVGASGCFWLGCRAFNSRSIRTAGIIVGASVIVQLVATLIAGPGADEWAGSLFMFFAIAAFAGVGSIESRRGEMGSMWSSIGFTIVLAVVALFYFARGSVLWALGHESELFSTWFNSSVTGIVSIVLTIVALTTATMLRSGRVTLRQESSERTLHVSSDGILNAESFESALPSVLSRARAGDELFAVASLRIDDLPQIGLAFGASAEDEIASTWRSGIRRYSPTFALVGFGHDQDMLVAFEPTSAADARRIASRIQRRLLDDFARKGSAVIPVVGVGVALSVDFGHDAVALTAAATAAARRSSTSSDVSIIVAESLDRRGV